MEMNEVSGIVYDQCLKAGKKETVLIITDSQCMEIGKSLLTAGQERTARCVIVETKNQRIHGQEPEGAVAEQMLNYDIIIAPTRFSLTHTKAVQNATTGGARVVTMPGINRGMYLRTIPVDYEAMHRDGERRIRALSGKELRVTAPSGTDIYLSIEGRQFRNSSGICRKGMVTNLPGGETPVAPVEGRAEGRIAVDISAAPDGETPFGKIGKVPKPFMITVDDGQMVDCGNDVMWKALTNAENGTNLAEFSLGNNPAAKITGKILEDEKVLGTGHIAFGTNKSLGGSIQSDIHLDVVFSKPTVFIDGRMAVNKGLLAAR